MEEENILILNHNFFSFKVMLSNCFTFYNKSFKSDKTTFQIELVKHCRPRDKVRSLIAFDIFPLLVLHLNQTATTLEDQAETEVGSLSASAKNFATNALFLLVIANLQI